ncbi:MAG: hypothetical protein J6K12_04295 [Clostridia bacterium]|nr:hypothetical protein [Clostridia bacterium]
MKRISMLFLLLIVIMTGCDSTKVVTNTNTANTTNSQEAIEGYWMSEEGNTLSFDSKGQAISNGMTMDYSIYADYNLSLSLLGVASEYRYSIENDVLTLVDLKENTTSIYYRNTEKQQEIQKKLKNDQEERERKEKLAEEKRENEQYISELKSKIADIDNEIFDKYTIIDGFKINIKEYERQIQELTTLLSEYENELYRLQNSPEDFADKADDYVWRQTLDLKQYIENIPRNIQNCKDGIKIYNGKISEYNEEIKKLETEKQELVNELESLNYN